VRLYPNALSASDVQSVTSAITYEVASRGVPVAPVPIPLAAPQLNAIGDSITFGQGVTTPWPSLLTLTNQQPYTISNWGITGISLAAIDGSDPNRAALRCQSSSGPALAIIFAGTNDFSLVGVTPAQVMNNLIGEVQTMKRAGCRVFVGTMLSRAGSDVNGTSWDADKDAYDALILSQAKANGADGIIDFAANPLLGADLAWNGAAFQSDHIHPTQAGQALLAAAASNVLNYTFGSNEASPTVVTSLNYAMQASDGYVSLSGLTGAGTLTLPDCTGQSGASYRINNPQSTFAVSVAPLNANQPINGLSTATVPANGTLTLRDVPNPRTVAGCHWEM
jgi:lysophospholipase L1-like esterase